ncbi:MAG: transposase [Bacteroidota bacterium]
MNASFRQLHDELEDSDKICQCIGLKKIPHFTTPQKFLSRIPPGWLALVISKMVQLLLSSVHACVDALCLREFNASYSYIKRIGRTIRKRDFLKGIFAADKRTGIVVSCMVIKGNRHEAPHFRSLLQKVPMEILSVGADKGFDSEKNQAYLNEHGIISYLDVRESPKRGRFRKRVYRRKNKFPKRWMKAYKNRRNRSESVNASFKRDFGDYISGKTHWMRKKILFCRVLIYNIKMALKSGILIVQDETHVFIIGFLHPPTLPSPVLNEFIPG